MKIKQQLITDILFTFSLLFLYFPIVFNSFMAVEYLILYGICIAYLIKNWKLIIKMLNKFTIISAALFIFLIGISFIYPVIRNTNDFSYAIRMIGIGLGIIRTLTAICLFKNIYKKEATLDKYIRFSCYAVCVLVLSTFAFLAMPTLKDIWIEVLNLDSNQRRLVGIASYVTRFSIVGFTGFSHTYYILFAVVSGFYIIFKSKDHIKIWDIITLVLVPSCGILFYGRIGIAVLCLDVILLMPIIIKKIKTIFPIIIVLIVILFGVFVLKDYNSTVKNWYNWVTLFYRNYVISGHFGDGSTDLLKKMYINIEPDTLLIGDGRYTAVDGNYYKKTDVGFIRRILFYGIIFTILEYMISLVLCYDASKNQKFSKLAKYIILLFVINTIIYELKGETAHYLIFLILPYIILKNEDKVGELNERIN